jgi:uncharacterized protein YecE (DUF72 family)
MHPVRIGTSGWNYDDWRGKIYPRDLPPSKWFAYYCQRFDTVEINNTFYQQPTAKTLDDWREQAPSRFLYAVKASRYLTHMRKLNNPRDPVERFLRIARRLKSRLGPLLYQLPPNWKKNLARLRSFVSILPKQQTHVIEFRNREWLDAETYDLLEEFQIAMCVHDMLPRHPRRVTGSIAYVRFHGPGKKKYAHKYRPSMLKPWADWIAEVRREVPVFAYFNNDARGYAVRDAETLRDLVA